MKSFDLQYPEILSIDSRIESGLCRFHVKRKVIKLLPRSTATPKMIVHVHCEGFVDLRIDWPSSDSSPLSSLPLNDEQILLRRFSSMSMYCKKMSIANRLLSHPVCIYFGPVHSFSVGWVTYLPLSSAWSCQCIILMLVAPTSHLIYMFLLQSIARANIWTLLTLSST